MFVPTPFDEAFVSILGGQDVIVDFFLLLFWSTVVQKRGGEVVVRGGASTVWGVKQKGPSLSGGGLDISVLVQGKRCQGRILISDGPWFYNNLILVLANYDGISEIDVQR